MADESADSDHAACIRCRLVRPLMPGSAISFPQPMSEKPTSIAASWRKINRNANTSGNSQVLSGLLPGFHPRKGCSPAMSKTPTDLDSPASTASRSWLPKAAMQRLAAWVPIRSLERRHRHRIAAHLLLLTPEDRYLRFGYLASDEQINSYAMGLDFARDEVLGIFNRRLELVAMAHLAYQPLPNAQTPNAPKQPMAEFGVSVLTRARGKGFGARLFEHAALHARNRGVDTMFIHALSENAPMLKIAQRHPAGQRADTPAELPTDAPVPPPAIVLNVLGFSDPLRWLALGWRDFCARPASACSTACCFMVMGWALLTVYENAPAYMLALVGRLPADGALLVPGPVPRQPAAGSRREARLRRLAAGLGHAHRAAGHLRLRAAGAGDAVGPRHAGRVCRQLRRHARLQGLAAGACSTPRTCPSSPPGRRRRAVRRPDLRRQRGLDADDPAPPDRRHHRRPDQPAPGADADRR